MNPSNLPPLEARLLPETESRGRGLLWVGCGLVLLLVVIVVAGIAGLVTMARNAPRPTLKFPETLAEKQQNLRAGYDPANALDHADRRGIERFLARVAAACNHHDQQRFRALINVEELHQRILLHPQFPPLNYLQRMSIKTELQQQEVGFGGLTRLRLVGLQTLDATHVLAYTMAETDYRTDEPWRIWLVKDRNAWQMFDWEQVEFGYSTSDRYAISQAATLDPQHSQYLLSVAHMTNAQRLRGEYKQAEAAATLRLAAACEMPASIADMQRYLIMLEWAELHNQREIVAICEQSDPALRSPGYQSRLATALQALNRPDEALVATLAYERVAGFNRNVVERRASLLEVLGRESEALPLYEQLQEYAPERPEYLAALYRLLPAERRSEWLQRVTQSAEPAQAAVQQAETILQQHDDQATARELEKFVAENAPQSIQHLRIQALLLESDGQFEQAAALHLQAAGKAAEDSEDQGEQASSWWKYFSAMHDADRVLEAFQSHPRPDEAFDYYASGFEDGESMLSTKETRPLVTAQLERNPQHLLANYIAGVLAHRGDDLPAAIKHFQLVTASTTEENQYLRAQAEDSLLRIVVQQGRAKTALNAATNRAAAYSSLAAHCVTERDWQALQQVNDAVRGTPVGEANAWFRYYEAKLAVQAKDHDRAVQQMLLAKLQADEGEGSPGKAYLAHLESEILADVFGLLEAYRKHPDQKAAFSRYQFQALNQHDWTTTAALCQEHRLVQPDDPVLLSAEWKLAQQQGQHEQVVALLQPWPEAGRFQNQWEESQAREALVTSLVRLQRFDEAQATTAANADVEPRSRALLHLLQGNGAEVQALQKKHRREHPDLIAEVARMYPAEFAIIRQDARVAETMRDFAAPIMNDLSAALVLLSSDAEGWSVESLSERFTAAVPGAELGPPRKHADGVSYPLILPEATHCQFQVTVGKSAYVSEQRLTEHEVLPVQLRQALRAQRSWLALEMSEPQPASASDAPWRLLRKLTAGVCDERTVAVGFQEPSSHFRQFVVADEQLPAVLRGERPLQELLASAASSGLFSADVESQSPAVRQQLKQLGREWRTAEVKPTVQVRIAITRGHRREQAWLRVLDRERTGLYIEHYIGEPVLPNPQTADLLPPGRYQFWGHEILEVRRLTP